MSKNTLKALRIVLYQEKASYTQMRALRTKTTYEIAPYSAVLGMIFNSVIEPREVSKFELTLKEQKRTLKPFIKKFIENSIEEKLQRKRQSSNANDRKNKKFTEIDFFSEFRSKLKTLKIAVANTRDSRKLQFVHYHSPITVSSAPSGLSNIMPVWVDELYFVQTWIYLYCEEKENENQEILKLIGRAIKENANLRLGRSEDIAFLLEEPRFVELKFEDTETDFRIKKSRAFKPKELFEEVFESEEDFDYLIRFYFPEPSKQCLPSEDLKENYERFFRRQRAQSLSVDVWYELEKKSKFLKDIADELDLQKSEENTKEKFRKFFSVRSKLLSGCLPTFSYGLKFFVDTWPDKENCAAKIPVFFVDIEKLLEKEASANDHNRRYE